MANKFKIDIICSMFLAAVCFNAAAIAEDSFRQNTFYTTTEKTTATISDQDLAKKIQDKIGSGWFSKGYEQVGVRVNNGNVILQGTVKTAGDKEKLDKEVRNIEGVQSLNSQVTVADTTTNSKEERSYPNDTYATAADEQLNKKIRDNVSRGWLWNSYKDITLSTTNGVVTIRGSVADASDQQKLLSEIQKVDGVKTVQSNLTINK